MAPLTGPAAPTTYGAPPDAPSRTFTGQDLFALQVATNPQIRPDGAVVAYTRVSHDIMADRVRRSIWLVDVATGEQTPLVTGDGSPTMCGPPAVARPR